MGLIVDSFAGGGGASLGIEWAMGRSPDIAINHDAEALAMHAANHPNTHHMSKNIWKVDPLDAVQGQKVDIAWFSPDCKHHSKAKGGKPLKRNIRDLAWVITLWAQRVKPSVIFIENVEEFQEWGPLCENDMPIKSRAGETFKKFIRSLRKEGYKVQWRQLKACEYNDTPTIRNRLFIIARCDGKPIVWPTKTNNKTGTRGLRPFATAADRVIDWSLPCPSIFATSEEIKEQYGLRAKRPLADNTLARIAKGMQKFIFDNPDPFLVPSVENTVVPFVQHVQHGSAPNGTMPADDPLRTVTAHPKGGGMALVSPFLVPRYGERDGQEPRCLDTQEPYPTVVTTANGGNLVSAFLAQHNTGVVGRPASAPVSTIMERGTQTQLVAAHMMNLKGSDRRASDAKTPLGAVTSGGYHHAEVRAFLMKFHRDGGQHKDVREPLHTVPCNDEFGLVQVHGQTYQVVDIGMRMLTPRELFRAQGFPEDYIIDLEYNGKPLTKTAQIKMCGNSVCPTLARAIVEANCADAVRQVA